MSHWVLFKLYDNSTSETRRALVNLDLVEKIEQPLKATYFELTTADGRCIKIETTADELLIFTSAGSSDLAR